MIEISLGISILVLFFMIIYLGKSKQKSRLRVYLQRIFILLEFYVICMFLQKTIGKFCKFDLIYFEYVTGLAAEFIPPMLLILSIIYNNENVNIKLIEKLLFIVPFIALICLWTNDITHIFYIKYSTMFEDTKYGIMFVINTVYSYACFAIGIAIFIRTSFRKSGFFSTPTLLMVLGCVIPVVVNVMGVIKIIPMSVYVMPILFTITAILYSIAIIKYKALNITPIAQKTIMDTMTDAFVVISQDGTIVDCNKLFREEFIPCGMDDKNYIQYLKSNDSYEKLALQIEECKNKKENQRYFFNIVKSEDITKYYDVDISPIFAKKNRDVVGILLLIKDVTQHMLDIKELEEKQEIIAKQAQLVSIGELAGGVAHDINTPISAIKTGITMLKVKEDRDESEKQIIDTMENCSDKIINIVNSMRNQIRNLGGNTSVVFKISNVVNDIKCITYHEIAKYRAELEVDIEDDLSAKGDPAKLGQVLTNLIMNAAQAYKDKNGGKINIVVMRGPQNYAIIKVIDFAGGIEEEVSKKIFKSMLTTKGVEGTGLGLYLAYSVVKGSFNGEINFDTEVGVGTTFYIKIPACN